MLLPKIAERHYVNEIEPRKIGWQFPWRQRFFSTKMRLNIIGPAIAVAYFEAREILRLYRGMCRFA